MRRFSGLGGNVYEVGDSLRFKDAPLLDCGGGWDWRAPDGLQYWLEEELRFEVFDREWWEIGAVEVHHRSGRVGLERCVASMAVRASGSCRPTSLLFKGERWNLDVEAVLEGKATLGAEVAMTGVRTMAMVATIEGIFSDHPIDEILVRLPMSGNGEFVGIGSLTGSVVNFDEEGARYVIA